MSELRATHQRKKGSQQARNADIMIPSVLAAFRSLFILLVIGGSSGCGSGDDWSTVGREVRPAEIPLICRCLLRRAAATLLLKQRAARKIEVRWTILAAAFQKKLRNEIAARFHSVNVDGKRIY